MTSKSPKTSITGSAPKPRKLSRATKDPIGHVLYYPLCCSQRMVLAVVGFFGFVNLYALRINMSVAMVCMLNNTGLEYLADKQNGNTSLNQLVTDDIQCPSDSKVHDKDGEFIWDRQQQGFILGSFFYGYLVTQIPGGWIAERYGGKNVFGYCMLLTAIATILTPIGARTSWILLIVLRIIEGLGEGVVFPAMHTVWSHWSPPLERSKLVGFTYAGCQIGNVLTLPLSALLCDYGFDGGWASIFYVFGMAGVVWFGAWMFVAADTPHASRWISREERLYIEHSLEGQMKKGLRSSEDVTPWKKIWTSPRVWAIVVAHTCANFGTYMLLTNIPTYMKDVLRFDIKSNGALSAVPYVGYWVFINVAGFTADALRTRGWSTTIVRKMFMTISMFGAGCFLIGTGFMNCNQRTAAVAMLTIAVSIAAVQYAGFVVNHVDIAPKYAGILFGISNTFATLSGIFAPYAVGVLTTNRTQAEWQNVFYVTAAIMAFGAIFYLIFGTGQLQNWAKEELEESSLAPDDPEEVQQAEDTV